MMVSSPSLYSDSFGGRCLTHIGTEGPLIADYAILNAMMQDIPHPIYVDSH